MIDLLDLIFPPFCVMCGRIGKCVCDYCAKTIQIIAQNELVCPVCERLSVDGFTHITCKTTYSLDGLISFFRYKGAVKHIIKEIKYRFSSHAAASFTSFLPTSSYLLLQQLQNKAFLVPIPLHPNRLRYRGFNQAESIARQLSLFWNIPVSTQLLVRSKDTTPQAALVSKKERMEHMKNVFTSRMNASGVYVLVDDVFTTGATLKDACRALKKAGAENVFGVTIAR